MEEAPRPSESRLKPVKVYGGRPSPPSTPKRASPVLAGVLVGILAAVVWVVIVYTTGYEIGWVAWGVGAVIGRLLGDCGCADVVVHVAMSWG